MIAVITAIALLCQATPSGFRYSIPDVRNNHIKCQQWYLECYEGQTISRSSDKLVKCIKKQVVK